MLIYQFEPRHVANGDAGKSTETEVEGDENISTEDEESSGRLSSSN